MDGVGGVGFGELEEVGTEGAVLSGSADVLVQLQSVILVDVHGAICPQGL